LALTGLQKEKNFHTTAKILDLKLKVRGSTASVDGYHARLLSLMLMTTMSGWWQIIDKFILFAKK